MTRWDDELVRTAERWKIASRRVDDFLWRRQSTTGSGREVLAELTRLYRRRSTSGFT